LPVARELGETSLMLLVHPTLTEQNINDTITVVKDIVTRAHPASLLILNEMSRSFLREF